jgi:hypothetical protein
MSSRPGDLNDSDDSSSRGREAAILGGTAAAFLVCTRRLYSDLPIINEIGLEVASTRL